MTEQRERKNTIRTYAVTVVTITSLFIMGMVIWSTTILAAPNWCSRAINAEKLSDKRADSSAFEMCREQLLEQISSLAVNSHIYASTIALCLLVLMVIVIAGGQISFKADKTGVSGNIGRGSDPVDQAVDRVADAAVVKAEEIKAAPHPAVPPVGDEE